MKKFSKLALGLFVAVAVLGTFGAVAHAYTFNTDMSMGMTNADVQQMQMVLNMDPSTMVATTGAGSPGMETMYFGAKTKAAVMNFQSKYSSEVLAPASLTAPTGFVGRYSRAKLTALSTSTPVSTVPGCLVGAMFSSTTGAPCSGSPATPGCPTGALFNTMTGAPCSTTSNPTPSTGADGSLVVSLNSTPSNNVSIDYNQSKAVYGVKVKAQGSAIKLNRINFDFDTRIWRYATTASIWDGSTKLGEIALSESALQEVTSGSDYRLTFSDVNWTIPDGSEKVLTLKITAASIVQNPPVTIQVSVPANGIRHTNEAGFVNYDGTLAARTFTIDENNTGELTISKDSTSPDEGITIVDDTATTNDATLLVASLKATGNAVNVNQLVFTIATGTENVEDVVDAVNLYRGSTLVAGATITNGNTASATATFDDLDEDIAQDATVKYTVKVDLKELDGVNYNVNETVMATLAATTTGVDAEDADFNQLTNSELSGGATGEAQHLFVNAPVVTFVSAPTPTVTTEGNGATQTGTYTIKFTVKAQGSNIYIDEDATENATLASEGVGFDNQSGTPFSSSGVLSSTADDVGSSFEVLDGTTETFTLTVASVGNNEFNRVALTSIGWDTDSNTNVGGSMYNFGLDDYKTTDVYLAA